jgi:hypothetical protein
MLLTKSKARISACRAKDVIDIIVSANNITSIIERYLPKLITKKKTNDVTSIIGQALPFDYRLKLSKE